MTGAQARKFMEAIEASGIKKYSFNTDVSTTYYNDGESAIAIPDYTLDGVHAVKKNGFAGSHNNFDIDKRCCYYFSDFGDIHEVRTAGTNDEIKTFLEAMGLSLTDEQVKILKWMDGSSSDLKPITGNYTFKYISDEEYEKLTPEEKAAYDEAKKQYELRKAGISGKASISVTMG